MSSSRTSIAREEHHQAKLRVLIVSAHSFVRAGLERLVEEQLSLELAASVSSYIGLQSAIAESDPDVIFFCLEDQPNAKCWAELASYGVPIVLLAESADFDLAAAAIAAGVHAIIIGDVTGAELAAAASAVESGLLIVSNDLAAVVRQGLSVRFHEDSDESEADAAPGVYDSPEHLTLREQEVLEMIAEGLSNKEIAAQLNISAHTVKFHISSILGKLAASSRAEAAVIGLRRGLITM